MAAMAALGSLEEEVRATEQELRSVWAQIGYSDAVKTRKTEAMKQAIRGMLEASIASEKEELSERTDALELTVSTISIVTQELTGTTASPQVPSSAGGLLQKQAAASKKLAGLEKERQQRLQTLQEKQREFNSLRADLGKDTVLVEDGAEGADLTRSRLDRMETTLQQALQEHEELSGATVELMTQTQEMERSLGIEFAFRVPAQLSLRERHDRLVGHLSELVNDQQHRQEELDASKKEISKLSDRLSVPKDEQEAYFSQFAGKELFKTVLAEYKEKIASLKQELKDRLHAMVSDLRAKIIHLWGIIGHDESDKAQFLNDPLGMTTSVSEIAEQGEEAMENFLGRHEAELAELQKQHAQLKPILSTIKQREDAKERLVEISKENVYGKDANRGGKMYKLLKETKHKEKLVKECEKRLLHLVPQWEASVGKPFYHQGERLLEVLQPRVSSIPRPRPAPTPGRSKEPKSAKKNAISGKTPGKKAIASAKTPATKAKIVKPLTANSVRSSKTAREDHGTSLRTPHRVATSRSTTASTSSTSTRRVAKRSGPTTREAVAQKPKKRTKTTATVTAPPATEALPQPVDMKELSAAPVAAVIAPSITPKAANITRGKKLRAPASARKTPKLLYRTKGSAKAKTAFGNAANRPADSHDDVLKGLGKRLSSERIDENACMTPMRGKRQRMD